MREAEALEKASRHLVAATNMLGSRRVAGGHRAYQDVRSRQARTHALLANERLVSLLGKFTGEARLPEAWRPGEDPTPPSIVGSIVETSAAGPSRRSAAWHLRQALALAGEHLPSGNQSARGVLVEARKALQRTETGAS